MSDIIMNDDPDIIEISETRIKYINCNFKKLSFKMYDYTCDVKITVGGETFKAHKEVLEGASDYFAAMFNHPMQERDSNTIDIKGMSEEGFSAMMEYFYHGYITIDGDTAEGVTEAARFLHITWILDRVCHHYLIHHLSLINYNLTAQLCEEYFFNGSEMVENIFDYFGECFEWLSSRRIFRQLPIEAVVGLLSNRSINADEIQIYKFVVDWLFTGDRLDHTNQLINLIRFPLMSIHQLDDLLQDLHDGCLDPLLPHLPPIHQQLLTSTNENAEMDLSNLPHQSPEGNLLPSLLHQFIYSAIEFQQTPYKQCLSTRRDAESRGAIPMLLLYSGIEDDTYINYGLSNGHGFLTEALDTTFLDCVFEFAKVVVLGNHLFVAGGYNRRTWCSNRAFYSFAPNTRTWAQLTDMLQARVSFSLCSDEREVLVYAIGGIDHVVRDGMDREEMHASVEVYNPRNNLWHESPSLPSTRFDAAAVCINGDLYVTGGISDDASESVPVSSVYVLKCGARMWECVDDMREGRHGHTAAVIASNKLIVLGGWKAKHEGDDTSGFLHSTSMEIYDIVSNSWTLVELGRDIGHIYHSQIMDDHLWIVSGESRDEMLLRKYPTRSLANGSYSDQAKEDAAQVEAKEKKEEAKHSSQQVPDQDSGDSGTKSDAAKSEALATQLSLFAAGIPCSSHVHKMICLTVPMNSRAIRKLQQPFDDSIPFNLNM